MLRAAKICPMHGCPNPQPCAEHTPRPWAGQGTGGSRGYGWAWTKTRVAVLKRDRRRCCECGAPATDVHHRVARVNGGTDDLENLISLCAECHHKVTARQAATARRGQR